MIGSYGRDTGIHPGKDVDVFLRFTKLNTRSAPRTVFDAVWKVIVREYGQFGQGGGRAQQQARSVKVLFPDHGRASGGDFSVDAVPAVRNGGLWAIPTKDQNRWVEGEGRWVTTGAVLFGELSTELNQSASSPKVTSMWSPGEVIGCSATSERWSWLCSWAAFSRKWEGVLERNSFRIECGAGCRGTASACPCRPRGGWFPRRSRGS